MNAKETITYLYEHGHRPGREHFETIYAELDKPITEHPDVQRLIIQVETLSRENKRLSKRDCNATIQIQLPKADSPFNKEDCCIVDVGVMDNIYIVECTAVADLQAENNKLKAAFQIIIEHEEARKKCGIGYDLFVHDAAVKAVVF